MGTQNVTESKEQLYTPADVKRVRDRLVTEQNGVDPLVQEKFKETPVLDHDHKTQRVRAALNRNCNAFEGKVVNAWTRCMGWLTDKSISEVLRNLADYYEQDYSHHPLHPGWIKRVCIEFNKLNETGKKTVLESLGYPTGSNGAERKKLFKKAIMTRKHQFQNLLDLIERSKN